MKLNEGVLVLCTVERISGATIFAKIEGNGEGTIVASEIASGRIRNLRDYVVPGKKIVCKILKIDASWNINLSLRRVAEKERKEVLDFYERERNALSIFKSVLKEKAGEITEKIKKELPLSEFLQHCKTEPKKLEEYLGKDEAGRICKILEEKKEKQIEVKKEFKLSSKKPNGIVIIKDVLSACKNNCDITYLAAGRFSIKIKAREYKLANSELDKSLAEMEKKAKENKAEFEILGK